MLCAVLLAAVLAACLWVDLDHLFESPYPYGIDGYYYLAQVNSIEQHGRPFRDAPPLTFWAIRGLAFFFPTADAIKLASVAFLFLSALLAFCVVYSLTRSPLAAVFAFALMGKGFMRVELLVDFLKQSLGHAWVLGALFLLASWLRAPRKRHWVGILLCVAGAALTHKLALALTIGALLAFAGLRVLQRLAPGRAYSMFNVLAVALTWAGTALAPRLAPWLPDGLRAKATQFFVATPHLNLGTVHDSLGPERSPIPLAPILTVLLLLAAAACWAYGAWLDRLSRQGIGTIAPAILRDRPCRPTTSHFAPPMRRFCTMASILMPFVALAYSPFLLPAAQNEMGLHLRLIVALTIPASILIPAALAALPHDPYRKAAMALAGILLFVLVPPFWQGFPGPPPDGGELHEAMLEAKDTIPQDAVIVTDHRTGNMVNALWNRPRIIANRYAPSPVKENHYRFKQFPPEALGELAAFARDHARAPFPTMILGSWMLLREDLYREFCDHLKTTRPDLCQ